MSSRVAGALLVCAVAVAAHNTRIDKPVLHHVLHAEPWDSNYAPWRDRTTVSAKEWAADIPPPVAQTMTMKQLAALPKKEKQQIFKKCLQKEATAFTDHVLRYRSPRLKEITAAVRTELDARGASVAVAVFWGRERYVSILWRYLERNLRANGGIVDQVILITNQR